MERNHYPTIGQSIFLVLICFNMQLLGGVFVAYSIRSKSLFSNDLLFVLSFLSVLLTILAGLHFGKNSIREYFKKIDTGAYAIINVILLVVGSYILILTFNMLLYKYIQGFRSTPEVLISAYRSLIGILHIIAAGPIVEEILFRGIILQGLLKNYSAAWSVAVSSILFGLLHFNIVQSLVTAVLGIMLGFIFIKTGSLWICIISHIVYNSLTILSPRMLLLYSKLEMILPILLIIGAVMTCYALWNLSRMPNKISHTRDIDN